MTQDPKASATKPTLKDLLADDPHFEFTLSWDVVAPVYQKAVAQAARKIKQPGFRPGKVPASLAEDLLDDGYLIQTVVRQLAPKAYQEELTKQKVKPFAEPEIVITTAKKNQPWVLTAYLPQKPVVKLPAYQKFLKQKKAEANKKITTGLKDKKTATEKTKLPDEAQIQQAATDRALMALLQEVKPQVSLILVRRTAQREWERLQDELAKHQLSLPDYLKKTGLTTEKMEEQLMLGALQNLQLEFILDALLEAEKITASKDEVMAKIKESMKDLSSEQLESQYQEATVKDYFTLLVKREKLARWLTQL